jgi:hypothetical protein
MAKTATYSLIDSQTLSSAVASITFSSIPSTFTDLVIITNVKVSTQQDINLRLNGDTATNYSNTWLTGNGTSPLSGRYTNLTWAYTDHYAVADSGAFNYNSIININNYASANTYKVILSRANNATTGVDVCVNMWRSNAAITSVTLIPGSGNLAIGSTFRLYGIEAYK